LQKCFRVGGRCTGGGPSIFFAGPSPLGAQLGVPLGACAVCSRSRVGRSWQEQELPSTFRLPPSGFRLPAVLSPVSAGIHYPWPRPSNALISCALGVSVDAAAVMHSRGGNNTRYRGGTAVGCGVILALDKTRQDKTTERRPQLGAGSGRELPRGGSCRRRSRSLPALCIKSRLRNHRRPQDSGCARR
jgi:hypothetical protein